RRRHSGVGGTRRGRGYPGLAVSWAQQVRQICTTGWVRSVVLGATNLYHPLRIALPLLVAGLGHPEQLVADAHEVGVRTVPAFLGLLAPGRRRLRGLAPGLDESTLDQLGQ